MAKLVLLCIISMELVSNNVHAEPFFRKDYTYIEEFDSFYKLETSRNTWYNAKKICVYEGAELWIPESESELNAVAAIWDKIPKKPGHIGWVGITDIITEGSFVSIDGRVKPDIYINWAPGEPTNSNNNEDCIGIYRSTMNDVSCNALLAYVCKKRHSTLDWNVLCDMPHLSYKYSNDMTKCYKVHERPKNWDEAHAICTAEQSYLTIINSVKERDVLVKYITDAVNGNLSGDLIHVGFHNKFEDNWTTVKGTSLESSGYAAWADNKPDQDVKHKCGAIQLSGELRGISCDKAAPFICEHDIETLSSSVDEKHG